MARHTVMPSSPGSITSSTIRSKAPLRAFCSPSVPSPADMASRPSRPRCSTTSSRMWGSSSTTSTRPVMRSAEVSGGVMRLASLRPDRRVGAAGAACHRFFIPPPRARQEPAVSTSTMRRTTLSLVALVVAATISVGAYYARRGESAITLSTDAVTRGAIVTSIASTGTLEAVTTVQVGTQVSGTIEALSADFNSIVRKGQVLAKLDQSTYISALEQAQASLVSAEADAERLRVARGAADMALTRARDLAAQQLLPSADLQTAETAAKTAATQVVGADAKIKQAHSAVDQAQVSLAKTVIASPIDGVVIARNVDIGQTVAASLQAPTLFVIAADLSEMQVDANIDESDVGQVKAGQTVSFRVDAYPSQTFEGQVRQVRLDPATVQNVVTYSTIIDAPNPQLLLKPGMTANVTIEVGRRDDVLRAPNAALRFRPDADVLAKFAAGAPASGKGPTLWVSNGAGIVPVAVRTGASDGSHTELVDAPFAEGTRIVTRSGGAVAVKTATSSSGNPLMPTRPQGPRPGGL